MSYLPKPGFVPPPYVPPTPCKHKPVYHHSGGHQCERCGEVWPAMTRQRSFDPSTGERK